MEDCNKSTVSADESKDFSLKIQEVLLLLKLHSSSFLLDDTVLQKFQSYIDKLITEQDNFTFIENMGIVSFIEEVLDDEFVRSKENYNVVTFGLNISSTLLKKEDYFLQLSSSEKILENLIKSLPLFFNDMSMTVASLRAALSLMSHQSGYDWVLQKELWKKLALPCLCTRSIYIRRECVHVASSLLVKLQKDKLSEYIHDLDVALCNTISELNQLRLQKEASVQIAEIYINIDTLLLLFHELLIQTLGKQPLTSVLEKQLNFKVGRLIQMNFDLYLESFTKLCRVLFLFLLHKVHEQLLGSSSHEDFNLIGTTWDLIGLYKLIVNRGYISELLAASFDMHKYWMIFCKNMEGQIDNHYLSKCESLIFLIYKLQLLPLEAWILVLKVDSQECGIDIRDEDVLWKEEEEKLLCFINENQKAEVECLEILVKKKLMNDKQRINGQCISCLSSISSTLEYFTHVYIEILLARILILMKLHIDIPSSCTKSHQLFNVGIYTLSLLIERLNVDSNSEEILLLLNEAASIQGMRNWGPVKVSCLKAMGVCIRRGMHSKTIAMDRVSMSLTFYLSDIEWEVRDSALEFICSVMKVAKDCTFFVDWFLQYKLLDILFEAFGDIESYVQASAISVISHIVSFDEIWSIVKERNIEELALQSVYKTADKIVQKSGLLLIESLFENSRFSGTDMSARVIPITILLASDDNIELRSEAVSFICRIIKMEFNSIGVMMCEGSVCHSKTLDVEKTKKEIMKILYKYCANGSLRKVVTSCYEQADESIDVLLFIKNIICSYELQRELTESSSGQTNLDMEDKGSDDIKGDPNNGNTFQMNSLQSKYRERDCIIETILETSDLFTISQLKQTTVDNWWDCGTISNSEIPSPSPISIVEFLKELDQITSLKRGVHDASDSIEGDLLNILEDILLASESAHIDEDIKAMDCY